MKKICIFILSFLLAVAFCSCNSQKSRINMGDDTNKSGANGNGTAVNRGDNAHGQNTESSGISLIERAYSYGDFSLPSAGSNPNNNVG